MAISLTWPAGLEPQADGSVLVRFPDFSEALTDGDDEADARRQAADCLAEAIAGRLARRQPIPHSRRRRGVYDVPLEPLLAAKVALSWAMEEAELSNVALARQLACDEREVRRLLDPRHASKMGRLEDALAVLGKCLRVEVLDVA